MRGHLLKFFGFAIGLVICVWFGLVNLTAASAATTTIAYVVVEWLFNKRSKRSENTNHG
jgi:high-affinity Fe2+/Pb2+ permease